MQVKYNAINWDIVELASGEQSKAVNLCADRPLLRGLFSVARSRLTLQPRERQAALCFSISRSLLRLTSIESMMPSNHLTLRHPLRRDKPILS